MFTFAKNELLIYETHELGENSIVQNIQAFNQQ